MTNLLLAFDLGPANSKLNTKRKSTSQSQQVQCPLLAQFDLGENIQPSNIENSITIQTYTTRITRQPFIFKIISRQEQKQFVDSLIVNDSERECIANYVQGTDEWLKSRIGRLTGSVISAAVGHNHFCNHKKLISQLLWDTFIPNDACAYGTANEKNAANVYEEFQRRRNKSFSINYPAALVHSDMCFFAYSPDGIFSENNVPGLLEIKCPFKKKFYASIPLFYFDQVKLLSFRFFCFKPLFFRLFSTV